MRLMSVLIGFGVLLTAEAQISKKIPTESQTERRIHNLETELSKLRMLHNRGKDRLRTMERELFHYQTIFQGLEILCKTLKVHRGTFTPLPTVETPIKAIKPTVSGITAHSVTTNISPIGGTSVVQISVRYSTTETHEVIWAYNVLGHMVPIQDGDPYSSVRSEKEGERLTTHLYINAKDLRDIELLYVKILSEFSEITILFNKEAVLRGESTKLSPIKLWNEAPSPEVFVLDPNKSATVNTHIDTNMDKLTTFVNFIGITTFGHKNELLDLQITDGRIQSTMTNVTRGFEWSVALDSSLVTLGGMLSLRVVDQKQTGPVLQIHVGKTMYIIPDKPGMQKAPFPQNSLALLSLYKNTRQAIVSKPPIGAIWCYAFGNPAPHTSIVRVDLNGAQEALKGRVFNIGHYDSAQVVVLNNVTEANNGQYLCKARSGRKVVVEPIYITVA